jgi:hypothetical protein
LARSRPSVNQSPTSFGAESEISGPPTPMIPIANHNIAPF